MLVPVMKETATTEFLKTPNPKLYSDETTAKRQTPKKIQKFSVSLFSQKMGA
jgi:hypothetical protein